MNSRRFPADFKLPTPKNPHPPLPLPLPQSPPSTTTNPENRISDLSDFSSVGCDEKILEKTTTTTTVTTTTTTRLRTSKVASKNFLFGQTHE